MGRRKPRSRNVGAGKGVKQQLDCTTLKTLYLEERLTQAEIARRYGCTRQFVSRLLAEYGLARPPRSGIHASCDDRYDK